jgi:hypothetical protein
MSRGDSLAVLLAFRSTCAARPSGTHLLQKVLDAVCRIPVLPFDVLVKAG